MKTRFLVEITDHYGRRKYWRSRLWTRELAILDALQYYGDNEDECQIRVTLV